MDEDERGLTEEGLANVAAHLAEADEAFRRGHASVRKASAELRLLGTHLSSDDEAA